MRLLLNISEGTFYQIQTDIYISIYIYIFQTHTYIYIYIYTYIYTPDTHTHTYIYIYIYIYLYNDVNATRLWLVVAYDLSEYRYIDDVRGNLFSLFCSTWGAVLKMFVRLFRIKASKSLEKRWAGAIYKKEKWRKGDKKSSWVLKNPQTYKKSSQQLPSCVITTRDSLFCKVFSPLFCFVQEKKLKTELFEETVYK